jgi:hypothetical protein
MSFDPQPDDRCDTAGRVTRRGFLQSSAVGMGGMAGMGLLAPGVVFASQRRDPRPIPGGFSESFKPVTKHPVIHLLAPGIGSEMSTITDLDGVVGGCEIRGAAHGSDGSTYDFDADMRFMRGTYVGLDRRVHHGTFGFI